MGRENFNQMEEDLNVIEIDYLTTLIIFIDDSPRLDIVTNFMKIVQVI